MARGLTLALLATAALGATCRAQAPSAYSPYAYNPYLRAPGNYGMAYGVPSFGGVRTYSEFSSPYQGGGYGRGYAPSAILPGPYGAGLWRPTAAVPGYTFAPARYRTFAAPYGNPGPTPAVGYYAPAFGPPAFVPRRTAYYGY